MLFFSLSLLELQQNTNSKSVTFENSKNNLNYRLQWPVTSSLINKGEGEGEGEGEGDSNLWSLIFPEDWS